LVALASIAQIARAQQPPEIVDVSPIDGDIYYLINQHSGMQADTSVPFAGNLASQQPRSFTNSAQRWSFARTVDNKWEIRSVPTGLCLLSNPATGAGMGAWYWITAEQLSQVSGNCSLPLTVTTRFGTTRQTAF
jgi:hypothetical protein